VSKKIIIGTVVFPQIERFLQDFIFSINNQTYKSFKLVIFNDGYDTNLLTEMVFKIDKGIKTKILNVSSGYTPSEIRKRLIDYCIENDYEILIFADSDDTFSKNRVERIIENINDEFSIIYNDLYVLGTKEDYFNYGLPEKVLDINQILNSNFLGLSNSALNLKKLRGILANFKISKDIIAFDWFLFSFLIMNGAKAKRIDNAYTNYRIYDNNTAGEKKNFDEERLCRGIKIKEAHYKYMRELFPNIYGDYHTKLLKFKEKISNRKYRDLYIECINKKTYRFWWENIADDEIIKRIEGDIYEV